MPTAFEIGMTVQFMGWVVVQIMIGTMAFPNSRLYHYLYAEDEFFNN